MFFKSFGKGLQNNLPSPHLSRRLTALWLGEGQQLKNMFRAFKKERIVECLTLMIAAKCIGQKIGALPCRLDSRLDSRFIWQIFMKHCISDSIFALFVKKTNTEKIPENQLWIVMDLLKTVMKTIKIREKNVFNGSRRVCLKTVGKHHAALMTSCYENMMRVWNLSQTASLSVWKQNEPSVDRN